MRRGRSLMVGLGLRGLLMCRLLLKHGPEEALALSLVFIYYGYGGLAPSFISVHV